MRQGDSGLSRIAGNWPRSTASYFSTCQPPEVARGAWIPSGGASKLDWYSTESGSDRLHERPVAAALYRCVSQCRLVRFSKLTKIFHQQSLWERWPSRL